MVIIFKMKSKLFRPEGTNQFYTFHISQLFQKWLFKLQISDDGLGNCKEGQVIRNNHQLGPTKLQVARLILTSDYF